MLRKVGENLENIKKQRVICRNLKREWDRLRSKLTSMNLRRNIRNQGHLILARHLILVYARPRNFSRCNSGCGPLRYFSIIHRTVVIAFHPKFSWRKVTVFVPAIYY